MKKIALVSCASYFEAHRHIIQSVVSVFQGIGDYAIDIYTNYGRFGHDNTPSCNAEASVYDLLKLQHYDGAIIENNIGRNSIMQEIASLFKAQNVPYVAINNGSLDCPYFTQNNYESTKELIEHLIIDHKATKINLLISVNQNSTDEMALDAYKTCLKKHDIPYDETRVFKQYVGIEIGEKLYDDFKERGVEDCEAVVCFHDVNAIGLINRLTAEGIGVPEDVKVVSLHYSNNSMVYRPDITGILVEDIKNATDAALALDKLLKGEEVSIANYSQGKIKYGKSCGCEKCRDENYDTECYKNLVVTKINTAAQIQAMMSYNQKLGSISSVQELGTSIEVMMSSIGCNHFCICINDKDISYLTDDNTEHFTDTEHYFDSSMYILSATKDNSDGKVGLSFPTKLVYPVAAKAGDVHILMPIHRYGEVFGYAVIKNSLFPAEVYNYRICHESLAQSFEALHQQLILRKAIETRDRLRMQDFMTGTYNKEGFEYFKPQYFNNSRCVVCVVDVDGLKRVNDYYGHQQGDAIIQITANALLATISNDAVVIRYGGDEFLILSKNMDEVYWKNFKAKINTIISNNISNRKLPYSFRASVGYALYNPDESTPEETIAEADSRMYSDKILHHGTRF